MNACDELEKILTDLSVSYTSGEHSISVKPLKTTGFEVELTHIENEITVSFEGLHDHFENIGPAIYLFLFGLTDHCRLRVEKYGNKPWKWTMESLVNGNWFVESSMNYPFSLHFWRSKETVLLQNSTISFETLQEWDCGEGLKVAVNFIDNGQLEEAREILLSLKEKTKESPNQGIHEDIQRHLSLIDAEDELSFLMDLGVREPLKNIEIKEAKEIANQCADSISQASTYKSQLIILEGTNKGGAEYHFQVAKPDRFHVSRYVLPENDYDEWIIIGEQHWRVPFGQIPDLKETEIDETKSLMAERFLDILRNEQPQEAQSYEYIGNELVLLTYNLNYVPGLLNSNLPLQHSVQVKLWIRKHGKMLAKAAIQAEIKVSDGQVECLKIGQCFAGYNLDIDIYPPDGILSQEPIQK
jgi:hypothetical protein